MKKQKTYAWLLALAMLLMLAVLPSCGGDGTPEGSTSAVVSGAVNLPDDGDMIP